MEERELVRQLKERNDSAYRFIVDRYQAYILQCCFRFVLDKEIARDLTQEVFMEVHRSIKEFRSSSKLSTWLYRIAITKSLDHLKRVKSKKRYGFLKSIFSGEEEPELMLKSSEPNPEQLLENEDRRQVLAWAISSLPENQKVAFTLNTNEEMSYQKIAEVLHTTIPAVESLLYRARTNLRKKLYRFYKEHLL